MKDLLNLIKPICKVSEKRTQKKELHKSGVNINQEKGTYIYNAYIYIYIYIHIYNMYMYI